MAESLREATDLSAATPLIAVFDVGKTNAKIALVDPALGQEIWSARRPNEVIEREAGRELDVFAIERWLFAVLREAPERSRVAAIVPIAHGAAAVLVDHDSVVLAAPDYEDPRFDTVAEEYVPLRDPWSSTFSPNLPQGLNLGRQLFYLQTCRAGLFERVCRDLAALQGEPYKHDRQQRTNDTLDLGQYASRTLGRTSFPVGAEYVGVASSFQIELNGACTNGEQYRIIHTMTDEEAEMREVVKNQFDQIKAWEDSQVSD